MSENERTDQKTGPQPEQSGYSDASGMPEGDENTESFSGGFIKVWNRRINIWLLIVYAVLIIWSIYYLITYWGGLGPGLDY